MKRILLFVIGLVTGAAAMSQALTPVPGTTPAPTLQWRPVYHFTPEKNWTNDPNGLIFLNGEYQLYNQQNPYENRWGHMSWGHARSKDLLHWEHLPIAIPEKTDPDTTWIFSGSAVWDAHNTSGFCVGGDGCLVAIYTADQPHLHKESQYIAYSNDGGMSFTNYPGNPVIDLNKRDFRDPNVFWYDGSAERGSGSSAAAGAGRWIMTVALPAEHKVRFYGSHDLKQWELLSEFGPQGYIDAHWECPFLIQLPVSGGGSKWVLMNSAAGGPRGVFMQYFVGDFDGKTFTNDNPADQVLTVDEGDCLYAAIPWNHLPDDKKIFIGWMIPHGHKTSPWTGQMSIPRDLWLGKTQAGYRLIQQPAGVLYSSLPEPVVIKGMRLANGERVIGQATENTYWLDAEFEVGAGVTAGFKIARAKDAAGHVVSESVVGYDAAKQEVFVGGHRIPVPAAGGRLRLQVLLDKSSLEVFVNGGEHVFTTYIYPDQGAFECVAFASGGSAVIKQLKIWDMSKF